MKEQLMDKQRKESYLYRTQEKGVENTHGIRDSCPSLVVVIKRYRSVVRHQILLVASGVCPPSTPTLVVVVVDIKR